jgi:hypothetical protein
MPSKKSRAKTLKAKDVSAKQASGVKGGGVEVTASAAARAPIAETFRRKR